MSFQGDFVEAAAGSSRVAWVGLFDEEVGRGWRKWINKLEAAYRRECVSFM